jgi:hypothetical protein
MSKVGLEAPESYAVTPVPGWLVVAKDAANGRPIFINICSHSHIPIKETPIVFTLPGRVHTDAWGEESIVFDALVHPSTLDDIFKRSEESDRIRGQAEVGFVFAYM